jgi:hypothetical protein
MAIFGYNTGGASTSTTSTGVAISNTHSSTRYTATTGDTIVSYSVEYGTGATYLTLEASVYTLSSNLPSARQFTATNITVTSSAATYTSGAVSQSLSNGVEYTVAVQYGNASRCKFDTYTAPERSICNGTSLPATWTNAGTAATRYLQWVTYTTGSTYTLSADSGSFSLSGVNVGLLYPRTMAADVAAFALTGNDATLTHGTVGSYTLTADAASFVLTGVDATLSYSSIVIDDSFERSSVNVASSTVVGAGDSAVISLKPRYCTVEGIGTRWLEPSARVTGVNGYRPTFRFLDYNSASLHGYANWGSNRRPMYSYDRETWHYFDTQTLSDPNDWIEFRHNTAFTENVVYISRTRQVTPRQWGQFLEDLASAYSSFVGPTAAAIAFTPTLTTWPGQSFIVDEFSAQTDELGRTISQTPLYAIEINDTSLMPSSGTKVPAIISTGIHAGEDLADWALMRALEHLCGSSAEAQYVRRRYIIRVYGLLNAPGRQGGGMRGSFTTGTGGATDANRHYTDADGATLEIVVKPRTAELSDLGSDTPAFLLDFHGTYNGAWNTFKDTGNATETAFHGYLGTYSGFTIGDEGDSGATTVAGWGDSALGLDLSLTMEFGDQTPQSDANYVTYGAAIIKALQATAQDGLIPNGDATYSLTAEAATFTLAGIDSGLKTDRKITADSGSFALTGIDATLTYSPLGSYTLTADSATFALSGLDTSLKAGYSLSADQASFALTGNDATLTKGAAGSYSLTAEVGVFALLGIDTNLTTQRVLGASLGSFTLTGPDVSLTYQQNSTYSMTAATASFVFTGIDTSFARTRVLTPEVAQFVVTGNAVTLTFSGLAPVQYDITPLYLQDKPLTLYI